jgi:hypothetical protein
MRLLGKGLKNLVKNILIEKNVFWHWIMLGKNKIV